MNPWLLALSVYFCGYIATYAATRVVYKSEKEIWTIGHRKTSLELSFLSWIMFVCIIIFLIDDHREKTAPKRLKRKALKKARNEARLNKPAKW